ncbi:hypothetical protein DFH09DRAFT_905480 [Mycena vulgaris]|nr:hypothetical protein DFH09DRAFT_905480 [Mycena vulgaris]
MGDKRHPCPSCGKRFNRPSSLRIHANTHTGATPFRCPHPGCGRAFNVKSNMNRHFRNHSAPGFQPQSFHTLSSRSSSFNSPTSPTATPSPTDRWASSRVITFSSSPSSASAPPLI